MKKIILLLTLALVFVAACEYQEPISVPVEENDLDEFNETINETDDLEELEGINESKATYKITATEGDLVEIPVQALDPDGGDVSLTFGEPFNEEGLWLTEIGDEGRYLVQVTATDGLLTTSEYVLVEILRANRPPVVECPDNITVQETETVRIDCNIYDEDGDALNVTYQGWMNSSSKETDFGDRGEHLVVVSATDGEATTTANITVFVDAKNRPPVIEPIGDIEVLETESLNITPNITDPDGDDVTFEFSEPFLPNGTLITDYEDRVNYNVTLTATDGELTATESFELEILAKNRPPVLEEIEPIYVDEGEVVEIPVNAYDPDGEDLIISFSGWMNSSTRQTTHEDAYPNGCDERGCTATYYTTVTVSDGTLETSQEVEINVRDVNRPPEFIWG